MKLLFLYLSRRLNQYHKRKVVKHIVPNHSTTWLKSCSFPLDCYKLYCFTEKSAQPIMEHIFLFFYSSLKTSSTLLFILSWTAISSVTIFFSSGNGLEKKIIKQKCKDHLLAKNVAHCAKHKLPVLNSFSPDSDSCFGNIN